VKLSVIQVGVGGFVRGWLRTLLESDLADLAGIVDISDEALANARETHSLPQEMCFKDQAEAVAATSPQAVVCVTPPQFHKDVALAAAGAGLHCITEKPLSDDIASAREMVTAFDDAGLTLMVSQNYRHQPPARAMRQAISDGRIGDVGAAEVRFFKGPHFGGFREEMAYPLVKDMAIHHVDLMRYLTGLDPLAVSAVSWKPTWSWFNGDPSVSAVFEMTGGAVVTYNGSWVSAANETSWSADWRIEGPAGTITWIGDDVTLHTVEGAEALEPLAPPYENLEESLHQFVSAVENGTEPVTSGRDNLKSIEMVFRIIEAAEAGRRIEFTE